MSYCSCGHSFANNCAHRLSTAIGLHLPVQEHHSSIGDHLAGIYKGLMNLKSSDTFHYYESDGILCCSSGKILRANDMLNWYKNKGYTKHDKPNHNGDSVVFCKVGQSNHIYAIDKNGDILEPSFRCNNETNIEYYY